MKGTKKLTTLSLLVALAMILSYIESLMPAFVAVPGVKMGFSNIATLFALYTLGAPSAAAVTLIRVFLSALLFGNTAAFIFSLSGGIAALIFMILFKKIGIFSEIGVSVLGGVSHNAAQITAAVFMMENAGVAYYIFPLIISGTISGIIIGIISGMLIKRLKKYIRKHL